MGYDIGLAVAAFLAVIAAVLAENQKQPERGLKSIGVWTRVIVGIGALVLVLSIIKAVDDSKGRDELTKKLADIEARESPLKPTDFVLNVLAAYRDAPEGPVPAAVNVSGLLGNEGFHGELVSTQTKNVIPGGGRGKGYVRYRYLCGNLRFDDGLRQYPNVISIEGKVFKLTIDPKEFPLDSKNGSAPPQLTIDVQIPGRMIAMGTGSDGHFEKQISFK